MKKLLVILLFVASYAHAEIYTWTDRKGTSHYTNSIYEIPEKYRAKAKILNLGITEKKEGTAAQSDNGPPASTPAQQNQIQPLRPAQPAEAGQPREHPEPRHLWKRPRSSSE